MDTTPITRVLIQFGGLCMLVQREREPKGLFVLMPKMHAHCAFLNCHSTYLVEGGDSIARPFGGEVKLHDLAHHGPKQDPFAKDVAFVSNYVDNDDSPRPRPVPIDDRWFTGEVGGCLAARIHLPLGPKLTFCGSPAAMLVPDQTEKKHKPATLFGRVGVEITPKDPKPSTLRVADVLLKPDADGRVRFALLNVRPQDMKLGKRYNHDLMEHAHHLDAYYQLLQPAAKWCGSKKKSGPPILVGEKVRGFEEPNNDAPRCNTAKYVDLDDCPRIVGSKDVGPLHEFIDPYNCTIGGGCETGDC